MLESMACYGYYGEGHGATGETPPRKAHSSGYRFDDYVFKVEGVGHYVYPLCRVKAMDFAHAAAQMDKWARKERFKIIEYVGKNI